MQKDIQIVAYVESLAVGKDGKGPPPSSLAPNCMRDMRNSLMVLIGTIGFEICRQMRVRGLLR